MGPGSVVTGQMSEGSGPNNPTSNFQRSTFNTQRRLLELLHQQILDHFPGDVRQAEIAALRTVDQFGVLDPQLM